MKCYEKERERNTESTEVQKVQKEKYVLASASLSFCLCQTRTIAAASPGGSELRGNLCCALKALQRAGIVKALMNGSTGDPEPAPAGEQQASINSSCYCPIRIINTSAVL